MPADPFSDWVPLPAALAPHGSAVFVPSQDVLQAIDTYAMQLGVLGTPVGRRLRVS